MGAQDLLLAELHQKPAAHVAARLGGLSPLLAPVVLHGVCAFL